MTTQSVAHAEAGNDVPANPAEPDSATDANNPEGAAAAPDKRPEFRVALFGVGETYQRMLEIVTRHARHNPYRFSLAANRNAAGFDIALVDMTVPGGPEISATLRKLFNGRPVVKVGRRGDVSRGADEVQHEAFAAQVLDALNAFVERNLSAQAGRLRPDAKAMAAFADFAGESRLTDDGADSNAVKGEPDQPASRRPRALIVDDSPTVRHQLAVALHQMGMDCEAVTCAQEALAVLATREYEIVFADVVMPEIDGYQLTKSIKRNKSLRGLPVVILTSRSSPFDLAKGALAGCSSYLVKPVSLQSLRDTVKRQLKKAVGMRRAVSLIGV